MSQSEQNINDVQFILNQVEWFLAKPPEELMSYFKEHKLDALYSLAHPKGKGMLICGYEAYQRFNILAERFLSSQKDKAVNVHLPEYAKAIRAEFVRRFIEEPKAVVDRRNVDRMLSSAYRCISKEFDTVIHYIPCSIFRSNDPAEFEVGPVDFVHKFKFEELYGEKIEAQRAILAKKHQERCQEAIRSGTPADRGATPAQSEGLANHLVDNLKDFFSRFDWIAVVKIGKCDSYTSRKRALLVVEGALNILKLLLSQRYSDKLGTAYKPSLQTHIATLTRSSDNSLNISVSKRYGGNMPGDNWGEVISKQGRYFFETAARTLDCLIDPERSTHLKQRFLDALAWYGDAVSENSPAAQVVKYVSAIERMTGTGIEHDEQGNERGVTKIVTRRSTIFYHHASDKTYESCKTEISKIYNCRSNLVHGSISPFDESVSEMAYRAEQVARLILLGGLDFFNCLGLDNSDISVKDLKRSYLDFEKRFQH